MKLEVLLSAMFLNDYRYIESLNIKTDCIVINQCDKEEYVEKENNNKKIKFISTKERGLSRSRNKAIENSTADICILCDNDVEYVEGYENIILNAFEENIDYDIIVFFINRNKNNSKPYYTHKKKMGYISVLKVFSPEIAFRKKSLEDRKIKFKEEFGAGSIHSMGEENIFLYECLKNKMKILYMPIKIADLREEESTWFKGYTPKYFIDKGAIYYKMAPGFFWIFSLQFLVRKYNLYNSETNFLKALKYMYIGKKEYRRYCEKNEKCM